MTREKAKVLLPIIQAIIDGREIQVNLNGEWVDVDENHNCVFLPESYEYRVKPMITYRPFKDCDECLNEMFRHQPFGWIKNKEDGHYSMVTTVDAAESEKHILISGDYLCSLDVTMSLYTFADGEPFGIKTEE